MVSFNFVDKKQEATAQNEVKVQLRPQFVKMVQRLSSEKSDLFYNGHHCIEMCILSKYRELYGVEPKREVRAQVFDNTGFPSDDGTTDLMGNKFGEGM